MSIQLLNDHPKQKFLFFVAEDVNDKIRHLVRQLVEDIGAARIWVLGAPRFIDVVENAAMQGENFSDEIVGGLHEIYSALPVGSLPVAIDALHLEEIEQIVKSVQRVSVKIGLEFEFELDGRYVGTVENGEMDKSLAIGLIQEWRNQLAAAGNGR